MMFKGAAILVFTLCLVATSEAGWGSSLKKLAKKGLSVAKNVGGAALKSAASGALTSLTGDAGSLEELQNMSPDEYEQLMRDTADQLSSVFKPDAVNKVMDHLDMAINNEDYYMDY